MRSFDRCACCQSSCKRTFGDKFIFNDHIASYADSLVDGLVVRQQPLTVSFDNAPINEPDEFSELVDSVRINVRSVIDIKPLTCKFIC